MAAATGVDGVTAAVTVGAVLLLAGLVALALLLGERARHRRLGAGTADAGARPPVSADPAAVDRTADRMADRPADDGPLSVPAPRVRDMTVLSGDLTATPVEPDVGSPRPRRRLALSPSRAGDFKNCPLLYRYRAIDRLPEPTSPAAARGTLVHLVLQRVFERPADQRGESGALADVGVAWTSLVERDPSLAGLAPPESMAGWIADAQRLVRRYYELEDPRRFDPEAVELMVDTELVPAAAPGSSPERVPVRGILDRLDRGPDGRLRVVDYKTGRAPGPDHELGALAQLKFYALMVWRSRGELPGELRLIYLDDSLTLTYAPSVDELVAFERSLGALWRTVARAVDTGHFPARKGPGCRWCVQQIRCPEFGGTVPPYPGPPGG